MQDGSIMYKSIRMIQKVVDAEIQCLIPKLIMKMKQGFQM